jgi:hypothetical protein
MLAVDIKKMSKDELTDLLALNTKIMDIQYDRLQESFASIFVAYALDQEPIKEQVELYKNILIGFYNIEDHVVEAIADTMTPFGLILWGRSYLLQKEEIAVFYELYQQYRKDKLSTSETLSTIVDLLLQGLSDSDPESLNSLFEQLDRKLKQLPDIIKDDIGLEAELDLLNK